VDDDNKENSMFKAIQNGDVDEALNRMFVTSGAILIGLTGIIGLTSCGVGDDDEYVTMCVDQRTNEAQPEYMCDSPGNIYPYAMPYYMPFGYYHDHYDTGYSSNRTTVNNYYGTRITGGTTTAPKKRYGSTPTIVDRREVTVYEKAKQAGTPIKMNQDAKKVSTVTKQQKQSYSSSFGSSSSKVANKSSSTFRSSSSSTRRK
jgi:hypothetical protein